MGDNFKQLQPILSRSCLSFKLFDGVSVDCNYLVLFFFWSNLRILIKIRRIVFFFFFVLFLYPIQRQVTLTRKLTIDNQNSKKKMKCYFFKPMRERDSPRCSYNGRNGHGITFVAREMLLHALQVSIS